MERYRQDLFSRPESSPHALLAIPLAWLPAPKADVEKTMTAAYGLTRGCLPVGCLLSLLLRP